MAVKDFKLPPKELKAAFSAFKQGLYWNPAEKTRDGLRVNTMKQVHHLRWMERLDFNRGFPKHPAVANQ
jgi:hypothetical protein